MTTDFVKIEDVVDINPRMSSELASETDRFVDFIPMAQVSEQGRITVGESRKLGEVAKGYNYFADGDVLLAKITPCMENGKAAFVSGLPHGVGFGSTEFHVLRPSKKIDGRYLFYMLWNDNFRNSASKNMTGSAGQKRVPKEFLARFQIPLPPLADQKRIADILDRADTIRGKQDLYRRDLNKLTIGTYLSKFGSPAQSKNTLPLGECVEFVSGGTPSKTKPSYWNGSFPWVSPKDMKVSYISEAQDHVTDLAFAETTLKKIPIHSILFVIRGMILAHTIPLAINEASVAINQDMKALIPCDGFDPQFVLWSLKASHNLILSKTATAAHGTKRLEMEHLLELPIPNIPMKKQLEFATAVNRIRHIQSKLKTDCLFDSLVQSAFKGEL